MVLKGKIKFFSESKRFGFIECEGGYSEEFFFHQNDITPRGSILRGGDFVVFELIDSPKGISATNVKKIYDNKNLE